MIGAYYRWMCSLAFIWLALTAQQAAAQPHNDTIATPNPADVKALEIYPSKVMLRGLDDSQQLILSAVLSNRQQDLTADVKYEVANAAIVRVTSTGRVLPLTNGATEIKAIFGDKAVTIPVATADCDLNLPVNFGNQVVPIFTKLGCNAGGCHGKLGGQNGFALSLLGFDAPFDFNAIVKEARGRRVLLTSPEHSLLLLKASGQIAHGGGKRFDVDSDEYKIIKRWIAAGTPTGNAKDPVVTKISVFPEHRVLARKGRQQLTVLAHFSDGTIADVTHRAQYVSNEEDIAIVDGAALVRTLDRSGEAGIMARYQGHVAVFRATVPLGVKIPEYQFQHKTIVDQHTHAKWKELGIVPSEMCSDEHFLRRVSLDLTGTLPTPDQVKAFMADKNPSKRDVLIDKLLETPEYAYFFASKWADLLRVKRRNQPGRAFGTFAFHDWIRESIESDKPYSQFTREILAATGGEAECPPTVWYKEINTPEQFAD
ncbi:MAG TPA: DUF1549 domain-containing protein, partial [Gemmataceae bacterium]|nr:DUF1549 domain-containing protein [Gemmataceae bacterium]